ncbi:MAG TPA: RNB domain-containing ribonuclease, partial [Rhodocyclaceae bacterium]
SKRGAIDFDTTETRMVFDDNGKIAAIEPYERNEAHRVIEECMLAANVCASEFLAEHDHASLFRIHEGPTPERLAKLRDFLGTFGMQLTGGDEPTAKDYAQLLEKIGARPDRQLLQTVMLRSLRQAIYSPDNVGHFGLAYESYTHFTSPIRRYPDLLVHRAIKAVLEKKNYQPNQAAGDWTDIGLHCSMTERRADEATRDVENWLKCFYMKDRIGEEFTGSISSVVPFGIFVALDDVYVEGLVHVSELGRDYFKFDDKAHAMLGERTGVRYRLSDRVRIQLMRVDMEQNKIDFRLVDGPVERPVKVVAAPAPEVVPAAPPAKAARKPKAAAAPAAKVAKAPVAEKPKVKATTKAAPAKTAAAKPTKPTKAVKAATPAKAKAAKTSTASSGRNVKDSTAPSRPAAKPAKPPQKAALLSKK